MSKHEVAALRQQIRSAGVTLNPHAPDGVEQAAKDLAQVEFETASPGGEVRVFMAGDGKLADVVFTDSLLDRKPVEAFATLLTDTISQAEEVLRHTLASLTEVRQ